MSLTNNFAELVQRRAACGPEVAAALLREGIEGRHRASPIIDLRLCMTSYL